MTLSALIKKGGLSGAMTATPATSATQDAVNLTTVAPVATVTVAESPQPAPVLSIVDESNIRAWLAHIEETDPDIIAEVLEKCSDDLDARRYFLKRAEEVPEPVVFAPLITCGDCIHFKHIDHPHLGNCTKNEPQAIAGVWDTDRRFCDNFYQSHRKQSTANQVPREPKYISEFPK